MKKALLLFFLIASVPLFAQNDKVKPIEDLDKTYYGIEAGIKTFDTYYKQFDFIREEAVYYYGYYINSRSLTLSSYMPSVSLKYDYRLFSDKVWLSAGLSYSYMSSFIGGGYSSNNNGYFFIMLNQGQESSYYYKIKSITENNHFVGLPIDIRYSPYLPRPFRLFFKLGLHFDYNIFTQRKIVFFNSDMQKHENEILDLFVSPDKYLYGFSLGVGFQLGRQNKPNFRVELEFPAQIFTDENTGLMRYEISGGGKLSFLIPSKQIFKK